MSRGASHCGVSQSAASQHVQEVERRLGVSLLDRSKRPLQLTPAGKLYSEYCRDVLRRKEEFSLALEGLKGSVGGTVRVVKAPPDNMKVTSEADFRVAEALLRERVG